MSESITIVFTEENDKVVVTLSYDVSTIDPDIVIDALYDLAESEEKSWKRYQVEKQMEENLRKRRN